MNVDSLMYFAELDSSPSFSKAAEKMFITQQGFGKAIASLESELGVSLVERSHSGVSLTPSGANLMPYAKLISKTYRELKWSILNDDAVSAAGQTRVFSTPYVMQGGRGRLQAALLLADIETLPFREQLERVEKSGGDVVFVAEIFPDSLSVLNGLDVAVVPFFRARPGVIWREPCPLPCAKHVHPEDLAGVDMAATTEKSMASFFSRYVSESLSTFDYRLKTRDFTTLFDFALQEGHASLFDTFQLASLALDADLEKKRAKFTPFADSDAWFYIGFFYSKRQKLNPATLRYIEWATMPLSGATS